MPKTYTISPYCITSQNNRHYLICSNDKYNNLSQYRLNRITEIGLTTKPIKPISKLNGGGRYFDQKAYLSEHVYMFSSDSIVVRFKVTRHIIDEVIDWFGDGVRFYEVSQDSAFAEVKVNIYAIYYWALQYVDHGEIMEPEFLREQIQQSLKLATEKYIGGVKDPHE